MRFKHRNQKLTVFLKKEVLNDAPLEKQKNNMFMTQVVVRKYNVDWLDGQVEQLYELLSKTSMITLFDDTLISDIIQN